jgi:hypothetical protein
MNDEPKKPKRRGPFGTGQSRGKVFKDPTPRDPAIPMTAVELVDQPPAGADVSWLWAELTPLREWLRRQSAELESDVDVDRVVRNVVEAVVAQRPALGTVPPQEYLRTLAEKLVLQAV